MSSVVALIGDVVGSRSVAGRQALHDRLTTVLRECDPHGCAIEAATITLGDEFQGVYASLGAALQTSFRVRAALFPLADVRFGLGRGEVQVLDRTRGIYDGSAYWAARAAIEEAKTRAARPALQWTRTAYRRDAAKGPDGSATGGGGAADDVSAVNAALLGLDHLVGAMDARSRRILGALLGGATQHDTAAAESVSASAVSQRVRRDGIGAAVEAMQMLGSLR